MGRKIRRNKLKVEEKDIKIYIVTVREYEHNYNYFVTDNFDEAITCAWEQVNCDICGEQFTTLECWEYGNSIIYELFNMQLNGKTKEEFRNDIYTTFFEEY